MKTDSIFFRIFQTTPGFLFELLGESSTLGENYEFRSEEVKQTAFRIDGVFVPKPDAPDQTVIFSEIQFQFDQYLYDRMFSEIGMYLAQNPAIPDWRAVAIFPRRSMEPKNQTRHRSLLQGDQFQVIYLEDLLGDPSELLGIQLMQLIVSKPKDTEQYLQSIVRQMQGKTDFRNQEIIKLVSTVMVYKFPQLSREEIEAMFTISELKQTKVYQEAQLEEAQSLILRQLNRRFGEIDSAAENKICTLSLPLIETLGEELLDFSDRVDLDEWLSQNN